MPTDREFNYDLLGIDPEFNYDVSPDPIIQGYGDGSIEGSIRDEAGWRDLVETLEAPYFQEIGGNLADTGKGKISLPYKAALKLEPEFGRYEAQTTGDCVSHATRNAGMIDYCVDVVAGETEYKGRFATENIYGYRGHGGQGASCARLAAYVAGEKGIGGFLVRKAYGEGSQSVDLTRYNSRIGHNWGRSGTPRWLNDLAKENPAKTVALITTLEEARDAIANGYGISVCSGYGFSRTRNEYGVASRSGSWSHAMTWCGCNDDPSDEAYKRYGGMLFLDQNSWGRWNSGPKRFDQPDGSFWIDHRTAQGMLRARGAWVISSVVGFKRRDLDYLLI